MKFLFVHLSFPGQYRHIIKALAAQGNHQIVGMGLNRPSEDIPSSVHFVQYYLSRGNTDGAHPWILESESKVLRGEACASAACSLRDQGFTPDLICAHPGWGEALFLKDIWPSVPILCYQEFFYNSTGVDYDFDPILQGHRTWQDCAKLRMKNSNLLLSLEFSDWNVTPTQFQRSVFPERWQGRISCIHDGIDVNNACPDPCVPPLRLPDGSLIRRGDSVVTFVNRHVEPYRGFHVFMRSLPILQNLYPDACIVIVGEQQGVSYGKAAPGGSWKSMLLDELDGDINLSKVHFTGTLPYAQFLHLLRISSAHVYLTYPFVLSWSLLEAMSVGAPVIGSKTAPVEEVISSGQNGLLVDFFDVNELASSINLLLRDRDYALELSRNARETIVQKYSLDICLPQHLSLLRLVAARSLS